MVNFYLKKHHRIVFCLVFVILLKSFCIEGQKRVVDLSKVILKGWMHDFATLIKETLSILWSLYVCSQSKDAVTEPNHWRLPLYLAFPRKVSLRVIDCLLCTDQKLIEQGHHFRFNVNESIQVLHKTNRYSVEIYFSISQN